ncbi:MAG: triphosphoribosyl-dephospho-CoA synthase [Promethearchaeota archaeon]
MAFKENLDLQIKSTDDLMRCITLSSLLELSGWPKPGNVHRTKDFKDTRFEHFLAGIAAIQPNFRDLCQRVYVNSNIKLKSHNFVKLGLFFKEAAKEMIRWQKGGNVLLGHILLLGPLTAAATICLKTEKMSIEEFKININKIIEDSTVEDTIDLYEAIRISNPGGLGKIKKYDVYDKDSLTNIKKDKINLKKIFELSKDYDSISLEYSQGFRIVLDVGLPYYFERFNSTKDINTTTVDTFLKILSNYPDTLIIRKSSLHEALSISREASEILKYGGISSEIGFNLNEQLDLKLHEKMGIMNPGTTADILAGIIFCALLFGLRF